uniref:Ig-like domain-containing protein n=1 Tax=Anolis carolinensis TaxID=28377 RepID=A0A803THN1_ANOCA
MQSCLPHELGGVYGQHRLFDLRMEMNTNPQSCAQKTEQAGSATTRDGARFSLTCNLTSVTNQMTVWYRQFPGQGPQYITGAYPGFNGESSHPKSTLHVTKKKDSATLELHHASLGDAAVYFCALQDAQCVKEGLQLCSNPSQGERGKPGVT